MTRRKRMVIYQSRAHLAVTFLFIALPFLFLLFFARIAHLSASQLFFDLGASFSRLFIAYVIAAVLAWVLGLSFYKEKRAQFALPLFDVLQSFPTFALLPIMTFFFRPSSAMVVFLLVITIIWPVLFSVVSTLRLTKHDWEEAVHIAGLRGVDYLRYFLVPASLPGLVTGSIIGLGEGWEALVASEIIVGIGGGLGAFFKSFSSNPTITALGILGLLIFIFSIGKLIWFPLLDWANRKFEE